MELAKKPIRFLCNADAPTFKISVPKTEHHYLFYKNQSHLIKFDLDIEFFRENIMFEEVDETKVVEEAPQDQGESEVAEEELGPEEKEVSEPEEKKEEAPERQPYSKSELQKMRKTDVRDILKKLAPEKSSPVRKENIIKAVLEAQEPD